MQEHLHIGRPSWKRLGRSVLIVVSAVVFLFVIGLHLRLEESHLPPIENRPDMFVGDMVEYVGFGPDEYYRYDTNRITPLFILIPPFFTHSDIHGMKWLKP